MFVGVHPTLVRPSLLSVLRPQDVFATSLYTGNGGTQSIVSGFATDLAWAKGRSAGREHALADRLRGANVMLRSNATASEAASLGNVITAFNENGFSVGDSTSLPVNVSGETYVGWNFKRAAKFFDIITYTGDGTNGRQIPHNLGIAPGMVIIKRLDATSYWPVTVQPSGSTSSRQVLALNSTGSHSSTIADGFIDSANSTVFVVVANSTINAVNASGGRYVAYLFAHDPDPNGIIQCGSAAANNAVTLPWKPQFLLLKPASSSGSWFMYDTARGSSSASSSVLQANTSDAEITVSSGLDYITPTGFQLAGWANGTTMIYLAIRAPI